jgi:hypothetical protein
MNLKEQFTEVEFNINDLETITEEFAINFMKWFNNLTNEYVAMLPEEELLKIYKKEKGL